MKKIICYVKKEYADKLLKSLVLFFPFAKTSLHLSQSRPDLIKVVLNNDVHLETQEQIKSFCEGYTSFYKDIYDIELEIEKRDNLL